MNDVRDLLATLTPEQRTRLENTLFDFTVTTSPTSIPRRTHAGQPLLSFAQEQLWFIQQLSPDSAFYNMPSALRLCGPVNMVALQATVDGIYQRHEALRTLFPTVDGVPVQQICDFVIVPIPVVDLRDCPVEEREGRLQVALRAETLRPFRLAHELPQRVSLYRLAEQEHVLLFVTHHIVTDYLSRQIFQREFCFIYRELCQEKSAQLPDLPIQYADFSLWQRKMYKAGEWQKEVNYWKAQLAGELPILDLPTDRPRPSVQTTTHTHTGTKESMLLPLPLLADLRNLCHDENSTLFMAILTAFSILLHYYSGQEEILIGSPFINRQHTEVEGLIGFFANTLPLRCGLRGDPTIRQLLARLRQVTLDAYDHQALPFEKIVEAIRPSRELARPVVCQAFLHFFETPMPEYTLPGLVVDRLDVDKNLAEFDLMLDLIALSEGFRVVLHYRTDLFDAATIQRLLTHFGNILRCMVATPNLQLSQLQILSNEEHHQLLHTWNQTYYANPQSLLHCLIEAQVQRSPNQVALRYREEQITYDEVNKAANQLAYLLCQKGVGAERLVALFLDRTPRAIIALLAVLKAGGAFILLDPTWPAERLVGILTQGQVKFVITHQAVSGGLDPVKATGLSFETICLDSLDETLQQQSTQNLYPPVQPDHLAYVVYTSGSTGEPKGVMSTHQALANYALFFGRMVGLSLQDRRLQFSSVGSEHFIAEVVNTLCGGATLIMRPYDEVPSIKEFFQLLASYQITIASLPVAYWQQWVQFLATEDADIPAFLRVVITGMDRVREDPFKIWQEKIGNRVEWFNVYGPAETTCVSTCYKADFSTGQAVTRVPIGQPISNVTHYILDAQMRPLPIGIPGELYIGGSGVARGYLNQPELTAERFVANPFGSGRLYRTGDFVRYLPSGDIEFIGRRDQQVKIRGYRVELGEIEAQLLTHTVIQDACVVAQEHQGDKALIAYVVSMPNVELPLATLRAYLQSKLPSYMIPAYFVPIAHLPRLLNGKVDQRALPTPEWQRAEESLSHLAPRNETEQQVAVIWQELLQLQRIGVNDNFFVLNGHSLLATQIVARINTHFQVDFPLRRLFNAPTIAEMATIITQIQAESVDQVDLELLLTKLEALPEEQRSSLVQ